MNAAASSSVGSKIGAFVSLIVGLGLYFAIGQAVLGEAASTLSWRVMSKVQVLIVLAVGVLAVLQSLPVCETLGLGKSRGWLIVLNLVLAGFALWFGQHLAAKINDEKVTAAQEAKDKQRSAELSDLRRLESALKRVELACAR
ncbi:hypothetical protein [Stenotrophomonas maltophilia]|uniref:Transmembrane protein n=1 Tax=Stenotrophomonas maltophilia TaxID=40324 RepID=A0A2W6I2K2_STEMA|nr:hypothetical protein [Stenotrophomonas maltophilia]PZS88186.1 hypothetical protein A7X83_15835 [Stenotrophomonas maltophilia]